MVLSMSFAWVQVSFLAWFKIWWCSAQRAVRGAVKGAAVCVGCATVLCCRGYGPQAGSNTAGLGAGIQAAADLSAAGLTASGLTADGQAGAPTGAQMAGMAMAAAVIKTGLILDNAVVSALRDPKITQEKKKALRRLNVGYSLAKLSLIASIAKGFSWYVDKCDRKSDRVHGVLGGLSAASLVLMSLASTVWV
jgi:hypothetical protein